MKINKKVSDINQKLEELNQRLEELNQRLTRLDVKSKETIDIVKTGKTTKEIWKALKRLNNNW